jgi:hypothetical protein
MSTSIGRNPNTYFACKELDHLPHCHSRRETMRVHYGIYGALCSADEPFVATRTTDPDKFLGH